MSKQSLVRFDEFQKRAEHRAAFPAMSHSAKARHADKNFP